MILTWMQQKFLSIYFPVLRDLTRFGKSFCLKKCLAVFPWQLLYCIATAIINKIYHFPFRKDKELQGVNL